MRELLRGDWHVHSDRSDDAVSSIDENLAAAVAAGLAVVRCTEHVRASSTWVADHVRVVAATQVPGDLEVRTGVEAKLLDVTGALDVPHDLVVGAGGVDGIVVADHQVPTPEGPWSPRATREAMAAGLSAETVLDWIVEATVGAMRATAGHGQLAHPFSILPKIGLDETDLGADRLERWASETAATGTLVEVNEKWACPSPASIRAALARDVRIVASTDAHRAEDVGRYDRVAALLAEAGA